jgi:hypothetical protein
MRKHNPLAVKTHCRKTEQISIFGALIERPNTQKLCAEKEEAPNGGSGASSVSSLRGR